jgi:tellurite resistance protein
VNAGDEVAARKARKTTRRSAPARVATRRAPRSKALTLDQAIIAVLIGSMMANDNVAPEESERAHHITWSMRRFRRRSGDTVGRLIERVRERIVSEGPAAVVQQASKVIPAPMRPSVLAVAADLVLVDGTLQRQERQFLGELSRQLKIAPAVSLQILKAISIKNAI